MQVDSGVQVCPFKGLAHYEADDAPYFCGRDAVADDLLARLIESPLVGIVGPSGSGKSSILRAGLLPRLAAGAIPGSDGWRTLLLRPGAEPMAAVDRACLGVPLDGAPTLVAVDQLEEVFTLCRDERERGAFLDALASGGARVVVCLRADLYGRCAESPRFGAALAGAHVLLGPMRRDDLVEAIEAPAQRAGLQVEAGLIDALADDVAGSPGALPLLSTMLLDLWRRRQGRTLTLAAYLGSGGVRGAVARLGEEVYGSLDPPDQAAARRVLLRLCGHDEALVRRRLPLEDAARDKQERRVLHVLVGARLLTAGDGSVEISHEALLREWPRLRDWLLESRDERRLHAHLGAAAREWVAGGEEGADLYRGARLATALEWAAAHPGELRHLEQRFLDAARAQAEQDARRQQRRVRQLRAFLGAALLLLVLAAAAGVVALRQRQSARSEARVALARQLGAEAVSAPRIDEALLLARDAVAIDRSPDTEGTLLATLLRSPALIATLTAPPGSRPQRLTVSPDGRTLAVSDNTPRVLLYDARTRRRLATLNGLGQEQAVVWSPDGSRFLAFGSGLSPGIDLFDARTRRLIRRLPEDRRLRRLNATTGWDSAAQIVVSPDGRRAFWAYDALLADGRDGPAYVDVWDLDNGALLNSRPVEADGANELADVAGGGRLVVMGTTSATVLDARSLAPLRHVPLPAETDPVDQVGSFGAIAPDGRTAALGSSSGAVSFIDLRSGRVRRGLGGHAAEVTAAAFAPDSRLLATAADDGSIIVWNTATARPLERLSGHAGRVLGLAFAGSATLWSASLDGAVFAWDLGARRRFGVPFHTASAAALPPQGPDAPVPRIALSPDGAALAAQSAPARLGLYSTALGRHVGRVPADVVGQVTALAWSARGTLAAGGEGGRVALWQKPGASGRARMLTGLGVSSGPADLVEALAFSPQGDYLAAGDREQTPPGTPYRKGAIAVWSATTGHLRWRTTWHADVHQLAISSDGRTIVAALDGGRVLLLDARTGRAERTLRLRGAPPFTHEAVAISRRGIVAAGSFSGMVQLWDAASGRALGGPLLAADAPIASIAFSRDGSTFATTGGSDGLARLWTTATRQQLGATFPGDPGHWGGAAFTPQGRRLVVVYDDGSGMIWPTGLGAWERHACTVAGRNLTSAEWRRFAPGRPPAPCR